MLLVCVFRPDPSPYSGTPPTIAQVKFCIGLDSTCLEFLPLTHAFASPRNNYLLLRGSLHVTVSCVVPLSVNIEWEIPSLIAHRENACSV